MGDDVRVCGAWAGEETWAGRLAGGWRGRKGRSAKGDSRRRLVERPRGGAGHRRGWYGNGNDPPRERDPPSPPTELCDTRGGGGTGRLSRGAAETPAGGREEDTC